jgi:uncharacterized protein
VIGAPPEAIRAGHPSMFHNPPDSMIREILSQPRRIAVVGCSPDPSRDSHRIAQLLIDKGHTVVPVNPHATQILGHRCYPTLQMIPGAIDMVDIFRRANEAGAILDEAIAVGARIIWMQLGVIDEAAAVRAQAAGLTVVMDRCPAIEYRRLW